MQRKEKDRGNIAAAEYKGDPEDMQICPQNAKTPGIREAGVNMRKRKNQESKTITIRQGRAGPSKRSRAACPFAEEKKTQDAAPASHKITAEGK
jgi:hypothetical protein